MRKRDFEVKLEQLSSYEFRVLIDGVVAVEFEEGFETQHLVRLNGSLELEKHHAFISEVHYEDPHRIVYTIYPHTDSETFYLEIILDEVLVCSMHKNSQKYERISVWGVSETKLNEVEVLETKVEKLLNSFNELEYGFQNKTKIFNENFATKYPFNKDLHIVKNDVKYWYDSLKNFNKKEGK